MQRNDNISLFLEEVDYLWRTRFPDSRFADIISEFMYIMFFCYGLEDDVFLYAFHAFCFGQDPRKAVVDFLCKKIQIQEELKRE